MLKTYKFKTHCKDDSDSSKTANIILPGLVIKQRWTTLRLQAKWYSNSLKAHYVGWNNSSHQSWIAYRYYNSLAVQFQYDICRIYLHNFSFLSLFSIILSFSYTNITGCKGVKKVSYHTQYSCLKNLVSDPAPIGLECMMDPLKRFCDLLWPPRKIDYSMSHPAGVCRVQTFWKLCFALWVAKHSRP